MKAGKIDVIVCLHMDRFLRSTAELLKFIDLARETGYELHTVESGSFELNTSAGKLVAVIMAAVAENEIERKAGRHRAKSAQLVQAGKSTGGRSRLAGKARR